MTKRWLQSCVALALWAAGTWTAAGEPLRIVAFNCECLAAPGTRVKLERYRWDAARIAHLERVANVIESLKPDVINLEEVTSADAIDQLVKILHEKGLTQYQGYHVESHDGFTGFDVAVISRFKPDLIDGQAIRIIYSYSADPKWREKYSFVDDTGAEQKRETSVSRNALYFITIAGRKFGFLGLHLKANPDDPASNAQRTAESHLVQRIIREEIVARGYQPIVLGDLNDYDPDVPDRDETRDTKTNVIADIKNYDSSTPEAELANAAEKIVRQADRYTSHWDRNENGTLDSDDVRTMIDHVLIPKSLLSSVKRTFINHTTDLQTSDHWPVVVDLELEPVAAAPARAVSSGAPIKK